MTEGGEASTVVRASDARRSELAAMPEAERFEPADRPMAGHVTLPADCAAAAAANREANACATAAVLPPKAPKAR